MLTVADAAARCCVSETIVRGWVRDGLLPHLRVGAKGRRGKILIQVEDLDGLMAGFKVGGRKEAPPARRAKVTLKHLRLPS